MITEVLYKCEKCGATWLTEQEAQRCEASHIDPEFISYQNFPLMEKYPDTVILTMANGHTIQYRYDKPILDIPSENPYVKAINVSRNPQTNQVTFTAVGDNLPNDDYEWVILFDTTRVVGTSNEPVLTLSTSATKLYDLAYIVKVKISAPSIETGQFVVKYTE